MSGKRLPVSVQLKRANERVRVLEGALASARKAKAPTVRQRPARVSKDDTIRVVFPDLHGSAQDSAAVAAFLADVKRICPDEVIGLGDIFDAGGFLAQHHTLGYVAEAAYTFEDDIAAANGFLDSLQGAAPRARIELLEGNHEGRIEKWCVTSALRNQRDAAFLLRVYAPEVLLRLRARGIAWHRRSDVADGLSVGGAIKRGKVVFMHGIQRGRSDPASVARRFGCSVVHGHTHHVREEMISPVSIGEIGAWSIGCLSQRQPLWQHGDSTDWVNAYAIQIVARSGRFLHFTVPIVHGESLLPSMSLR